MKNNKTVIELKGVGKLYKLFKNDRQRFMAALLPKREVKKKQALHNISLRVKKGESIAILGKNGAGKSTLVKLITGVTFPTKGELHINGRIGAMLELTAGFDEALTGRENIYLRAAILGIDKTEIELKEAEIISFADIGEYIDQPVRYYSSGMKARLGFAINAHTDPDILIIDEALSVGDRAFKRKCHQKVAEIRLREQMTLILITHSMDSAVEFCKRGVIIDDGGVVFDGNITKAVERYCKM